MSFLRHAQVLGGKLKPQPNCTHVLSAWVLPYGHDVTQAQAVTFFFENESAANYVAKQYHNPPEMAFVMTFEQYKQVVAGSTDKEGLDLSPPSPSDFKSASYVCKHCGVNLTRFEFNGQVSWTDEHDPVMGTKQYCWVDPAHGSQRHEPR